MYSSLVLLAIIISLELQECHQSALDMTHVYFTIVCLQCKKVAIFKRDFLLPFLGYSDLYRNIFIIIF